MLTRPQFLVDGIGLAAATAAGTHRDPAFTRLAQQLEGRVLVPGGGGYDSARLLFNSLYDGMKPNAIVQAAGIADIRRTIAFAQHQGIPLVLRSGGHSFAGYCTTGHGMVLDVSRMNAIDIDLQARRVRVGPGVRLIQLLSALGRSRLTVPAGTCPTVAVAGLTLGGGIGRMTRKHGLTLDSLRRVRMIDARGRLLTADKDQNADLFWACRGGGGGNFGIVTELELDVVPIDMPVTRYAFTWPWSHRAQVFEAWQQWSNQSLDEFQDDLTLSTSTPGAPSPSIGLDGSYLGPRSKAEPHLKELQAAIGVAPTLNHVDVTDYVTVVKDVFCENISVNRCMPETEGGEVPRFGLSIKSTFVHGRWPAAALDVMTTWLERRQHNTLLTRNPPRMNLGKIWFDALGGAASSIAPDATAYPHRDATFCVQYQSRFSVGSPEPVVTANLEWLRGFHAAMAEWNQGAYVNYPDPDLPDYLHQYFGANLPRLRAVKRSYDPHNFFRFPQSIPV